MMMQNKGSLSPLERQKEMRQFGLIMAGAVMLVFGLLLPWLFEHAWPLWPWIVASVFAGIGLASPSWLYPVHWVWMRIGAGIGWLNTRIILLLVFYIILLPIGLLTQLLIKDPMARRLDASATTYRVASARVPADRLEKPF